MSIPTGIVTFTSSGPVTPQRVEAVSEAIREASSAEEASLIAYQHGARFESWPTVEDELRAIIQTQDWELDHLRREDRRTTVLLAISGLLNLVAGLWLVLR